MDRVGTIVKQFYETVKSFFRERERESKPPLIYVHKGKI